MKPQISYDRLCKVWPSSWLKREWQLLCQASPLICILLTLPFASKLMLIQLNGRELPRQVKWCHSLKKFCSILVICESTTFLKLEVHARRLSQVLDSLEYYSMLPDRHLLTDLHQLHECLPSFFWWVKNWASLSFYTKWALNYTITVCVAAYYIFSWLLVMSALSKRLSSVCRQCRLATEDSCLEMRLMGLEQRSVMYS